MSLSKSSDPIIYRSSELNVFLIDIPGSISSAQGSNTCPAIDSVLSCAPLETPYIIKNEPKTAKAITQMQGTAFDVEIHKIYKACIKNALQDIKDHVEGAWCLPRRSSPSTQPVSRATSAGPEITMGNTPDHDEDTASRNCLKPGAYQPRQYRSDAVDDFLSSLCAFSNTQHMGFPPTMETMVLHRGRNRATSPMIAEEPWESPLFNDKKIPIQLTLRDHAGSSGSPDPVFKFRIPPLSKLMLDDFNKPDSLRDSIRFLGQQYDLARQFELIIIDPPWPNRSAKRRQSYSVEPSVKGVKRKLLSMDLDTIIAPEGIVAIWITNKAAVRHVVTGAGGLFERLNLDFKEEWIWIKTTTTGEPVFDLNSVMKKPYEVLLIGQASPAPSSPVPVQRGHEVTRRVIAGVPDLHSRKPCLKSIIEALLPPGKSENYAALELFARHLVAGWWSFGNEVLKFNWEGYWNPSISHD
ncbi:MT-A70-domain-containing protein [Pseudovirgaria hyperparasitica]|uniref:MT-A70-domain-containing protein n=1 Tax=Pseudovirgaria hyperparasitica TaxID=470096 RepID=A0A6A6WJ59_9PEZI|nr:MT-A70-domain-containing protein [Pseudovirgaria hyperparasitica]KAF2761777.1 MT-A70-domain-containing protein [Pseudovirgaria hyperparasitica]